MELRLPLEENTSHDAGAQRVQSLRDLLDITGLDRADVGHEIGNISFAIRDLLVDVVFAEDLVHC